MIGSSGAVTVLFVPTNAPRLVGYDRGQGGRLGGGLHQPSCIREKRGDPGTYNVYIRGRGSHLVAV